LAPAPAASTGRYASGLRDPEYRPLRAAGVRNDWQAMMHSMANGVLHFDYRPQEAQWIARIMSKLAGCANRDLRDILQTWKLGLGELAGAIATRKKIIGLTTRRIDEALKVIVRQIEVDRVNVELYIKALIAYRWPNDLPYSLVADIDSFIFETKSAYELAVKFIGLLLQALHSPKASSNMKTLYGLISNEITARGGRIDWLQELKDSRDVFIHETTGWPALRVASLEPLNLEVVLLLRNVIYLDDPSSYISLTTFQAIYHGFCEAFKPIEMWLLSEIDGLDVDLS